MAVRNSLYKTIELSPQQNIVFEDTQRLDWNQLRQLLQDPKGHPIAKLSEEFCIDFNYKNITLRGYEIQKGFFVSEKGKDYFHIPLIRDPKMILEILGYFLHLHTQG